ncbi:hypothetical protein [Cohnella herbarum]|uniref:Uncharacterized protein n=1 Tax=Cohnella herbarum TaxID=2728023 RepID=A0A7Z2VJH3_9BACL|nr:hypothetical protein [Cohnella herbarum]QJD84393.1 hypothetical protein HH215_15220 [Cohnella herbarum]
MTRAERTFVTRCSLVVKPIDVWTGFTPGASSIRVALTETERKPIRTSDGSYAFLDYAGQTCTLVITSSTYIEYRKEIMLSEDGAVPPILTVSLLPNRTYLPPAAATGLIVQVCDESGLPLQGAQLSAYIDDESAVRGRLADDDADGECKRIRISHGVTKLSPGDSFVVKEREGTATEWNAMVDWHGDPSVIGLERPFNRKWNRGTKLLAAVRTTSDKNGFAVIPFRGLLPSVCPVNVEIVAGDRRLAAVWKAEGGRVIQIPPVRL